MSSDRDSIIIAGGGIAGLATACALSGVGVRSVVLEQAAAFGAIGAGVQFGPNAMKMLDRIGVLDEVKKLAIYPESARMLDAVTGEDITAIPYGRPFADRFKYPYALVHRADLHAALLRAVEQSDLVQLVTGAKAAGVSQDARSATVTCEDGRRFGGAAVVGADGLWSVVRQEVIGDGAPRVSGHITYRAVLPYKDMPEQSRDNVMTLWAGDLVHVVHYPLRGGELYNLAATFQSERFSEGWDSFGNPEELHSRFAGKHARVRELLQKIETWRMWVLCDREPAKTWSKDRITLVGDAAHPMLQYIGQGAAMSLEDGVCLADELKKTPADFAAAAKRYQERRYLRTARAQVMARLYGEVYHASGAVRELRNSLLSTAPQSYESMAWMYDHEA